ncbi:hypothetical protein L7F22_000693 [Adiantum nelumboides]|nr:hypothetical protein [Adiantum nelumboides]
MVQGEDRPPSSQLMFEEAHKSKEAVNEEYPKGHRECAGLIFMCDESTKLDCFKYRVFGLSKKKKNLLDIITKGMCLFLFDVKLKILHGIYAASSDGVFNLEPDAFGGNFPWQVKFHIEKACIPLPEDVFKTAIKDNYFASRKFKRELTSEQVEKLVKLFSPLPALTASLDEPECHVSPIEHLAFSKDTCTQTRDRHTEGATDKYIRRDPLTEIFYEPTSPLLDGILDKYCVTHDPLCMPGCATRQLSVEDHQFRYEAADPDESITSHGCIHGSNVLGSHQHSQEWVVEKPLNSCNGVLAEVHMHGIFAPRVKADNACVSVDLVPSHSQRCSSLASLTSLCECVSEYPLPASSHETKFWKIKVNGEPYVDNASLCPYVSLLPKKTLKPGVLYSSLGYDCRMSGHKRLLGELCTCAQSDAQGDAYDFGCEMPVKCVYH